MKKLTDKIGAVPHLFSKLIVLWCVAAAKDLSSLSMVACFLMFLLNDLYGFFNWLRLRKNQTPEQ